MKKMIFTCATIFTSECMFFSFQPLVVSESIFKQYQNYAFGLLCLVLGYLINKSIEYVRAESSVSSMERKLETLYVATLYIHSRVDEMNDEQVIDAVEKLLSRFEEAIRSETKLLNDRRTNNRLRYILNKMGSVIFDLSGQVSDLAAQEELKKRCGDLPENIKRLDITRAA